MINLKSIDKRAFLLLFILILVILPIFLRPQVFLTFIEKNKQALASLLGKAPIFESSQAEIFIDKGRLNFKFDISKQDQAAAAAFLASLSVDQKIYQGISLELDQNSLSKLSNVTPTKVNLNFEGNSLKFNNINLPNLQKSTSAKNFEIATESGKFKLSFVSEVDFDLEVDDPKPILNYATSSGQLNLSEKLTPLFPILDKIAKIRLTVNGKSISGEVVLK